MHTKSQSMMGVPVIDTSVLCFGLTRRKRCDFRRHWENPKSEIGAVVEDGIGQTGFSSGETSVRLSRQPEANISAYRGKESWLSYSEMQETDSVPSFSYYFLPNNDLWDKEKFHLPWCRNDKTWNDSISRHRQGFSTSLSIQHKTRRTNYFLPPSRTFLTLFPSAFLLLSWIPTSLLRGCQTSRLSSLACLVYVTLLFAIFSSMTREVNACYKFPPGIRDPCEGQVCKFGAECMSSIDGKIARCQCPSDCPSYGDNVGSKPVCGNDGNDYANTCELRKAACLKLDDIRVKYYGKCDPCEGHTCEYPKICMINASRRPECMCSFVCPSEINLVCGSDGRTYSNGCILRQQACKSQKDIRVLNPGKCSADHPCTKIRCGPEEECSVTKSGTAVCMCPKDCPRILSRVCGNDSITYDNECELKRAACTEKVYVSVKHHGPCGSESACSSKVCRYGAVCIEHGGKPVCRCPQCSEEYKPVCGDNGITYDNECKLRLENCHREENVKVKHEGGCSDGCGTQHCQFYAVCESVNNKPRCICPTTCVKVDAPVCGNDGVTYSNECELRVEACQRKKLLTIASIGTCDKCRNVSCDFNAKCENGICVCPLLCATVNEPVCGSDSNTYHNECEMRKYSCTHHIIISVRYLGKCNGDGGGTITGDIIISGSGEFPSGDDIDMIDNVDEPLTPTKKPVECNHENCLKFGGTCQLDNLKPVCSCSLICKAVRAPVCGSDGQIYGNDCTMLQRSCLAKAVIKPQPMDDCDEIDYAEACDGNAPIVDPKTNEDYDCKVSTCPANSYCHVEYSKCCRKESAAITSCKEMPFGCCSDNVTPANDFKGRGCPDVCNCNPIGSFSTTCDPITKQCTCKPGVGGKRCDRCEMGSWGLHKIGEVGNSGCIPCSCNKFGSSRDDCDQMTGRCMCKSHVLGLKCDKCLNGKHLVPAGCKDQLPASCDEMHCRYGGVCKENSDGSPGCDCKLTCDTDTHPSEIVCGSDGQNFGSLCQLQYFSCRTQQDITVANTGPCRGPPPVAATTVSPVTKSRKTTRHIDGSGSDSYIDDNVSKNINSSNPGKIDNTDTECTYIENLCLSNKDCCPAHSHCQKGLCYCKEGYIPSDDNTQCFEVETKPTEKIDNSINACTHNPCHYGTCIIDRKLGYRCACPLGKMGPLCNRDSEFTTPSFSGRSHLEARRIDKATQDLSIEIEFSTLNKDGIILYHAQNKDGTGDFVSLTINDGYVEFRYDLGAGPAILRSRETIEPIRIHRVIARRSKESGILIVDKEKAVSGSSPSTLTSLDLGDPLYLGYIPQAPKEVYDRLGVDLGLVGCIYSFRAGGQGDMRTYLLEYSQGVSDIKAGVDITECDKNPCKSMPCQNEGACIVQDAQNFECKCSAGFKGKTCETLVNPCASQPCQHGGTCVPVSSSDGFFCQCAQNYEGQKCERESMPEVFVPQFTGDSYLEIPLPQILMTSFSITVWFMTTKPDGMILLVTQYPEGRGDFIALMLENSSLVYTFFLGSGIGRIESKKHIHLDKWHKVTISRNGKFGEMTIDSHPPITGEAAGQSTALNIDKRPLYLGGFSQKSDVPSRLGPRTGFSGAIQRIIINGRTIVGLLATAVTMRNISSYNGPPCNVNPCANGGACVPMLNLVECRCTSIYVGERCEKRLEQVDKDQPIRFDGSTFFSYPNEVNRRVEGQQSNNFTIKFRTTEPDGILLLQRSGETVTSDYLSVAVSRGHVEFSLNLGRQSADKLFIVRSQVNVLDGQWHTAVITRQQREAIVKVDNEVPVSDTFPMASQQLDTDGVLWLGGRDSLIWELPTMKNFVGCVESVMVNNQHLHLLSDRLSQSSSIVFCT